MYTIQRIHIYTSISVCLYRDQHIRVGLCMPEGLELENLRVSSDYPIVTNRTHENLHFASSLDEVDASGPGDENVTVFYDKELG